MKRLLALATLLTLAAPALAQTREAARRHARKANELAASGKCAPAIPEFTAAYRVLKDPAILFNRAECFRKLGKKDEALADYKKFLADLPKAPNRSSVEARIADLQSVPRPPAVVAAPVPSPPPVEPKPPVPAPEPTVTVVENTALVDVAPIPEPALNLTDRPQLEEPPSRGMPTWFWIGLGVMVLAAGGIGGWYLHDRSKTEVPPSGLGNYRY